MLKAPNLLDLSADSRKDGTAQAAQAKIAQEAKSQASARKGSRDLLPLDPAVNGNGNGKGDASTPSSFHSKVRESRARLAAKAHRPAPDRRDPSNLAADKPAVKAKAPTRTETDRTERADRHEPAKAHARKPSKTEDAAAERAMRGAQETRPKNNPARETGATESRGNSPGETAGTVSGEELKDSLEALGIYASDEQLQDPGILADILAMIQSLSMQQNLSLDPEPMGTQSASASLLAALGTEGDPDVEMDADASTAAALVEAMSAEDALSQDPATDGRSAAETKASELIRNRIEELTRNPSDAQARIERTALTPATTPADWEGVKVRRQAESISTSPLPMADLDRMRVMQASALQATAGTQESGISSVELPGDDGSLEPMRDIGRFDAEGSDKNEEGGNAEQDQADLFGRNGDKSGNAANAVSKEGSLVAKDGATGPLFHNAFDQARTVEHRSAVERAWEPRQAMGSGVMDQIAKKLSTGGLKNGDEMSIQLSPEHLGRVRVSLEMKDGVMAARISVENDGVRLQVEAGLAALRDSLENQGIKLQGLEVSVDPRQSSLFNPDGSNSESFFHRNGRGAQGADAAAEKVPFESAPESDTGRRLGYNTMEYIG